MPDPRQHFGTAIRELREGRKLSQRAFRRRTGLSMSFLHWVESGRFVPGAENFRRITEAMDLDPVQLVAVKESWEQARSYQSPDSQGNDGEG